LLQTNKGFFENLKSWHFKFPPLARVLTVFRFDPKKDIGNVKSIKDPIIKHLKFPFKNL
jgi:hypothetical protein